LGARPEDPTRPAPSPSAAPRYGIRSNCALETG